MHICFRNERRPGALTARDERSSTSAVIMAAAALLFLLAFAGLVLFVSDAAVP